MATATEKELLLKIETLQNRLEESEQLIEAIKAGEVDAFALSGSPEGPEIFTLQSGDYAYRILIEEMGECALNVTEDGLIVYCNSRFHTLINLPSDQTLGKNIFDFIHPDSVAGFKALFGTALSGRTNGELLLQVGDRAVPVYISLTSLQPKIPSVGIIITDLTEKKKTEKIESSEKELQQLLKQAPVSIMLFEGTDFIAKVANEAALKTIERTQEAIIDKRVGEIQPDLGIMSQIFREVVRTGTPYIGKDIPITFNKSGNEYSGYYDLNYSPWQDAEGRTKGIVAIGNEVTEKVLAKKRIQDNEARLNNIIQQVNAGIASTDVEGHFTEVNDRYCEIVGHTREALSRLMMLEITHPDDVETNRAMIERCIAEGKNFFMQKRYIKDDGSVVWVNSSVSLIRNADGEKFLTAVVVDITAQRLADEKIRESENRLRFALEAGHLGAWELDLPTLELRASVHCKANFGRQEQDSFTYQDLNNAVHPDDKDRMQKAVAETITQKHDYDIEYRVIWPDHSLHWVNVRGQLLLDADGEPVSMAGISLDITEQKKSQQTLQEFANSLETEVASRTAELQNSQSFLEQLIDSSVEFIVVVDHNLRIRLANNRFSEIVNIPKNELLNKKLLEVNPSITESDQHYSILKAMGGETVHLDKRRATSGHEFYFDSYFIPLTIQDKVEGVIIMSRNVTDIVKSEINLGDKNRELQRINEELESFNYIASHDLQEPLRKIQTFLDLLQKNLDKPELILNYINKSVESATRMRSLIQSVLTYTKVTKSKAEDFVLTDFNLILAGVESDLELQIQENNAIIQCGMLPSMVANPDQIRQVFANLISNSLKFSLQSPLIEIAATQVESTSIPRKQPLMLAPPAGKYMKFEFRDNGIGFDPQYANRIFDLFQRLHTKRDYPGTGIGLSIVKKIIDHHNGYITASSTPGVGTIFTLWLPMLQTANTLSAA